MESIRTSSLFHYSEEFETLQKILAQGLKPNYCGETFSILDTPDFIVGIPMVSFCDIPLTRITNFREKYGKYAIGLSKKWGLKKGINPIFYATDNSFVLNSLRQIDEMRIQEEEFLNERMRTTGESLTTNGLKFNALSLKQSDSDFEKILNSFMYNAHLFQVRSTLFGFTKPYIGKRGDEDQNNYEENEWRFVLGENRSIPINWLWGDSYSQWRGDKENPKPVSIFHPLIFDIEDINFIILQNDSEIPDIIDYIEGLNDVGGNLITDNSQKSILISKIISMDRIDKDF
jgi:hypothetical protein